MRLALFQPDIPQNVGAIIRLATCFGCPVDIIEPCGFPFSSRDLRRSGMDYLDKADVTTHVDWAAFLDTLGPKRLILSTTKGAVAYQDFSFAPDDVLVYGRESTGAPDYVHSRADARVVIPMVPGMRSLNLATSAAITVSEALRQTSQLP